MQMREAQFIAPMLLFRSDTLPEGPNWAYELKLDGYRALAFKSYGVAHLRSRNNKSFDGKYPAIVAALARLQDETVAKWWLSMNPGDRRSMRSRTGRRGGKIPGSTLTQGPDNHVGVTHPTSRTRFPTILSASASASNGWSP